MNRTAIISAVATVIVYLEIILLLSFPYPEKLRRVSIEPDPEFPALAKIGYHNYYRTHGDCMNRIISTYREESRITTAYLPCKHLHYDLDATEEDPALTVDIDWPTGSGKLAGAVQKWIRKRFKESVYERDFTLDELVAGWRTLLTESTDREICMVYADDTYITYRDGDNFTTFVIATGRTLRKPILPASEKED